MVPDLTVGNYRAASSNNSPHLHSVHTTQGSKAPLVWMMSTKAADSLEMMFSASSGMAST